MINYNEETADLQPGRELSSSHSADASPLGLAAFALTTFVLSAVNAGIFPGVLSETVLPVAIFYGGFIQLLAGMWEFHSGTTFGATAFSSYGGFWMSLGAFIYLQLRGTLNFQGHSQEALGLFLLAWTVFTFYMWIASFRMNQALGIVFTLSFFTFVLLDLGAFGVPQATTIGGWFGLLNAVAAWYTSAAFLLKDTYGHVILPVETRKQRTVKQYTREKSRMSSATIK
ncbi:hypothetical protein D2Q93_12710 [Alicyclobacillaceae bacterium I2511]|nr:hypothetical protein D2Q93_12710 [Alicyclobacillaceae bacterium I2511]